MRGGDIDNTSYVRLEGSPSARSRVVYGIRRIPEHHIQVGYVQVDYNYVVVWRPYDPDDDRWDAPWASGCWRSTYLMRMPRDQAAKDSGRPTYGIAPFECDGVTTYLPRVEMTLHRDLKEHLDKLEPSIAKA